MFKCMTCGLSTFVLVLSALMPAGATCPGRQAPADAPADEEPLTIAASTAGRFAHGSSWHLSVNSAGQAELTIDSFPERTRRRFEVPPDRLARFRQALREERFFELASDYGERVPDGSEESLTVTAGGRTRAVRVHFLMNWVHSDRAKLREPARAVRLLVLLRGWFSDPGAVDLRKYDQKVLDAAKG
jgi:hypothetical protein